MGLHAGEIVEVKSLDEIISTLDENHELEGLPFMPEMSRYCGRKLRVLGRVDRMTVEGYGFRVIRNSVILEGATCNGEAHEGCKRTCFVLWKEAWLRRSEKKVSTDGSNAYSPAASGLPSSKKANCQSANLLIASSDPRTWDIRTYSPVIRQRKLRVLLLSLRLEILSILTGSKRWSMSTSSRRTPTSELGLKDGEIVEVKSKDEIIATLDYKGRNRGLEFTPEMLKYCGKRMRVLKRVDRMIIEKTGKMRQIANTVLLEEANCDGQNHGGCPRNCYCLFREIWLRRVDKVEKLTSVY